MMFRKNQVIAAEEANKVDDALNQIAEETIEKPKDNAPEGILRYWLVILMCFLLAFGGFVFGYDTGTISGFINMDDFLLKYGMRHDDGTLYMSKVRSGLLVAIFSVGAAIGCLGGGKVGDILGRKLAISISTMVYIVAIIIQISSVSKWYQYFIGRIISGLGCGALSVLVPMFQSEIAPQHLRGALVSSYQLMVTLGIFIGYSVCYGMHNKAGAAQFRIPLGLSFVLAVLLIVGMFYVPESPRWLCSKDRVDEAKKSMAFTNKVPIHDNFIEESIQEIIASIEFEKECGEAGWGELFTGRPRLGHRLMVGSVVCALQQLGGNNYFFYYGTTIFKAVGQSDSFATSMIFGVINFVSTILSLYTVDKFGRRGCLFYGAIGMWFCFLIYSLVGTQSLFPNGIDGPADKPSGNAMIFITCLYIFIFAQTWAPIAYVVTGETYPLRVRSKGIAVATGVNWMCNFLISFFTPFITGAIHYYYGFVFTGFLTFAIFFTFFIVPETKGLTLEQIDEMYASRIAPWKSASWKTTAADHVTFHKREDKAVVGQTENVNKEDSV